MLPLHLLYDSQIPTLLLRPFQKGVQMEVEVGNDLMTLLTEDLCLSEEGIAKIQTIFWQSKPVDDVAACIIHNDGVLALSAALPGLVGACLRRGGAWSALRDSISHQYDGAENGKRRGIITVKLFNFMLTEVGPLLLQRGILIDTAQIKDILAEPSVRTNLNQIQLTDREIEIEELERILIENHSLELTVTTINSCVG